MNLSAIIQQIDYWHRRLDSQRIKRRQDINRGAAVRKYHSEYCRRIITSIRQWQAVYDNWDAGPAPSLDGRRSFAV